LTWCLCTKLYHELFLQEKLLKYGVYAPTLNAPPYPQVEPVLKRNNNNFGAKLSNIRMIRISVPHPDVNSYFYFKSNV
jgi:hypothetical protein